MGLWLWVNLDWCADFHLEIAVNRKWIWWFVWPNDLYHAVNGIEGFWFYCASQNIAKAWLESDRSVVYLPITMNFRARKKTSNDHKVITAALCGLVFPNWVFPSYAVTYHEYFWCSRFCEFHSALSLLIDVSHIRTFLIHQINPVTCYNAKKKKFLNTNHVVVGLKSIYVHRSMFTH